MVKTIVAVASWLTFVCMIWLFFLDIVAFDGLNILLWGMVFFMALFATVEHREIKR